MAQLARDLHDFASLRAGLLVRKNASPAAAGAGSTGLLAAKRSAKPAEHDAIPTGAPVGEQAEQNLPEVLRQRARAAERLATMPAESFAAAGRKTAFTLRLDAGRHTRLRQASIHFNRSAQSIVTEALDRYLADLAQAQTLAAGAR